MKPSPLHLIRARGLLLAQPPVFAVKPRPGGSRGKHPAFRIKILRPDAPLRLLPRPAAAVRGKTAPAGNRPVPAA
jgi:hypothetical protein